MKDFKTSEQLNRLSRTILSQSNSKVETYRICWQYTMPLIEAIKNDIDSLFDTSCYIDQTRFVIEDSFYRQSANAVMCEIHFEEDVAFSLSVECLIDYGKIWLKVKNRPVVYKYAHIADKIESNYNAEWLAEIHQIDK